VGGQLASLEMEAIKEGLGRRPWDVQSMAAKKQEGKPD
jgi:hypothetical protein